MILLIIIIPYIFTTYRINIYAINNEPEGFHAPCIRDFWRVLVGAVVTLTANYSFEFFLFPVFMNLALKGGDD